MGIGLRPASRLCKRWQTSPSKASEGRARSSSNLPAAPKGPSPGQVQATSRTSGVALRPPTAQDIAVGERQLEGLSDGLLLRARRGQAFDDQPDRQDDLRDREGGHQDPATVAEHVQQRRS